MKNFSRSTPVKVTAIILLAVLSVVFLLSAAAIVFLSESNAYFDGGTAVYRDAYSSMLHRTLGEIYPYLSEIRSGSEEDNAYWTSTLDEWYSPESTNLFFSVTDSEGNTWYENYSEPYARYECVNHFSITVPETAVPVGTPDDEDKVETDASPARYSVVVVGPSDESEYSSSVIYDVARDNLPAPRLKEYDESENGYLLRVASDASDGNSVYYETDGDGNTVMIIPEHTVELTFRGYIRKDLTVKDRVYYTLGALDFLIEGRYTLVAVCILSFLIAVILFIFLMCSAGRRAGVEGVVLNPLDKIPFDLYAAFAVVVVSIIVAFYMELTYSNFLQNNIILLSVISIASLLAAGLMALSLLLTFAARVKNGKWWRNTIIFKLLYLCYRILRWFGRKIVKLATGLPLFWKAAVVFSIVSLFELVVLISTSRGTVMLWWFTEKIIVASLVFFLIIDWKRVRKGGAEIAHGNTDYLIDTKGMIGALKAHANDLNSIGEGLQKAVDDRMKSERLKTELITNVSHDLKTPLTSIVNYVDLLKKENIQSEKVNEYLEVLDRQSNRLKKLTVDLLEASKASTGNLPVNAEKTDVGVFLSQLAGEYEDKLAQSNLELLVSGPGENVYIYADGRLLWRVVDNLMNNIGKYAQPDTRVYVSAEVRGEKVVLTFKNISRYALNISSDELMERFVRGDRSRNTEGSGLGLSIARSLTDLQKGKFDLVVDGDLFKAIVTFDRYDGGEDTAPEDAASAQGEE